MDKSTEILDIREKRYYYIQSLFNEEINVLLTIKCNMMGNNKNNGIAYFVVSSFTKILLEKYKVYITYKLFLDSLDGPTFIIGMNTNVDIKLEMVNLEENNELGRLVDIDVFSKGFAHSLYRCNKRKCLICNNKAFDCIRNGNHSLNDLLAKVKEIALVSLKKIVYNNILEATLMELDLPYKFGCVSKVSNGSHKDMNYELMFEARFVIAPFLVKMFEVGYKNDLDKIGVLIKEMGIETEQAMYNKCNNINCYKGLIFSLGIICSSFGYLMGDLKKVFDLNDLFIVCQKISKDILIDENVDSFGYKVYKENNFGGIRFEALNGFKTIQKALSEKNTFEMFINIINNTDDSVLLKRAGSLDNYFYWKKRIKDLNINNIDDVIKLNNECINNNISCGGSADLLVCTLFVKSFFKEINLEGEKNA